MVDYLREIRLKKNKGRPQSSRQKQQQNQQEKQQDMQHISRVLDDSEILDKSDFKHLLQKKWGEHKPCLKLVIDKVHAAADGDGIFVLDREIASLLRASNDVEYSSMLRLARTIISLYRCSLSAAIKDISLVELFNRPTPDVFAVKYKSNDYIPEVPDLSLGRYDEDSSAINYSGRLSDVALETIFDLLVGNIISLYDYFHKYREGYCGHLTKVLVPYFDKNGNSRKAEVVDSTAKISRKAFDHLLEVGFEQMMGWRFHADLDLAKAFAPGKEQCSEIELKCPADTDAYSSPNGLYFKDGVLRFAERVAKDTPKAAPPNDVSAKVNFLRSRGLFDKNANTTSAWMLLAMVKNEHGLMTCDDTDEESESATIYRNFAAQHAAFIKSLPGLWGKRFYAQLDKHIVAVDEALQKVEEPELQSELKWRQNEIIAFNAKVNELLAFMLDFIDIGSVSDKNIGQILPLKLAKMFPSMPEKKEDRIRVIGRIEDTVASQLSGFDEFKDLFEQEAKEDEENSKIDVMQACLRDKISFLFPLADITSFEDGAFSGKKFFEILCFNIFRHAFGDRFSLSDFKIFCKKAAAQRLQLKFMLGAGDCEIREENVVELLGLRPPAVGPVASTAGGGIDIILQQRNKRYLSPNLQEFTQYLAMSSPEVALEKMLRIVANVSKADKEAQTRELTKLKPFTLNFTSQFVAAEQSALSLLSKEQSYFSGIKSCVVALYCPSYELMQQSLAFALNGRHSANARENAIANCIARKSTYDSRYASYFIAESFGSKAPRIEAHAVAIERMRGDVFEDYSLGKCYYSNADDEEVSRHNAAILKKVDAIFWQHAARVPGYDYSFVRKIDALILKKLAGVTLSPMALKNIRHTVLESMLVDQDQAETSKNWVSILDAIADIGKLDTSVLCVMIKSVIAGLNRVGYYDDGFDGLLKYHLNNVRFCSSYATKLYFRAVQESCKQLQALAGASAAIANMQGSAQGYEYRNLPKFVELLHKEKLGHAFLSGLSPQTLEPFAITDRSGKSSADEGFNREEAENRAFYERLQFFTKVYGFKYDRSAIPAWSFNSESNLARLELDLQKALLKCTAINDFKYFEGMVEAALGYNSSQQLAIAYCMNTAVEIGVTVNKEVLNQFIYISKQKDILSTHELGFSAEAVDHHLEQVPAIIAEGGVAARGFKTVIDKVNKAYASNQALQGYVDKIIRSLRVSGGNTLLADQLIFAFENLHKLDPHMEAIALEQLAALAESGTSESSLVNLLGLLQNNDAAGLLTNFAEAVLELKRPELQKIKDIKLPDDLLQECATFLLSCNKNLTLADVRISLAKSILLGYEQSLGEKIVSFAEFHELPQGVFSALEEHEVAAFVAFDKVVTELDKACKACVASLSAAESENKKLLAAKDKVERCAGIIFRTKKALAEASSSITQLTAELGGYEGELDKFEQDIEAKKIEFEQERAAAEKKLEAYKTEPHLKKSPQTFTEYSASEKNNKDKASIELAMARCKEQYDIAIAALQQQKQAAERNIAECAAHLKKQEAEKENLKARLAELTARKKFHEQYLRDNALNIAQSFAKKLNRFDSAYAQCEEKHDDVVHQQVPEGVSGVKLKFWQDKQDVIARAMEIISGKSPADLKEECLSILTTLKKDLGIDTEKASAEVTSATEQPGYAGILSGSSAAADDDISGIDPVEFHDLMTTVLAKRVSAKEYLWPMLERAFVNKLDLLELIVAIMHINDSLAEALPGEVNVIFKEIVKYYSHDPQKFIALADALRDEENALSPNNKALILKLIYAYIDSGEPIGNIIDLINHLAKSPEKLKLLESRLIRPPYWPQAEIIEKDADVLGEPGSYKRAPRVYAAADGSSRVAEVAAKFSASAKGESLFASDFESSLRGLDSKHGKFELVGLQKLLADKRQARRAEGATDLSDQEILEVVHAVAEVLARVGFDTVDGKKQAKELYLEQIMSVFAWLKLGFAGDKKASNVIWNQVATGEGKSRITAVAAGAAAVLSGGKTIEMAFSSPNLALRAEKEFAALFNELFSSKGLRAEIGVVADANAGPTAYKTSSEDVQAVNFVSTSEFTLAAKGTDVPLVKHLSEMDNIKIERQLQKNPSTIFLADSVFDGLKQELLGRGIAERAIRLAPNKEINKEIIAAKTLDPNAEIMVIGSAAQYLDAETIALDPKSGEVAFTDSEGVIELIDEAGHDWHSPVPCNISLQGDKGYWPSAQNDDGIYRYITAWVIKKTKLRPDLLSTLDKNDLIDFKEFVVKEEEKNHPDADVFAKIQQNLRNIDLEQLKVWNQSVGIALDMKVGFDFILEPGHRGEHGVSCYGIVPLTDGGRAMRGTTFSNGVHQILRYLLNSNQVDRFSKKRSYREVILQFFGWRFEDKLAQQSGRKLLLAKPCEAPILASKYNMSYTPEGSCDERDSNKRLSFGTTGTTPLHIAAAAGQESLVTPRKNDVNRKHLPTVFAASKEAHLQAIIREVRQCGLDGRPVFVLCENEWESKIVAEMLREGSCLENMSVQFYSSTLPQDKKERIISNAGKKDVVTVGTVIDLGRGIDVRPEKETKEKGGLHLIMTHHPEDDATYLQAIARSARNGDPGSVRVITKGRITSEVAISGNRALCSKLSGIAQIQKAYSAPLDLFHQRKNVALKAKLLRAEHQDKIDDLSAKLASMQSASRDDVNAAIVAAIRTSWLKSSGLKKAEQILREYHAGIIDSYDKDLSTLFIDEPDIIEALKLRPQDESHAATFKERIMSFFKSRPMPPQDETLAKIVASSIKFLADLKGAEISLQDVPVAAEYEPSHAGQAISYLNPLWFIDATLKGHNVIGDHIAALFRGGQIWPNLSACLRGRMLPPVIAELVAIYRYYKLDSNSNDKKVVTKSLLKISAYTAFLVALAAAPLLSASPAILALTALVCTIAGALCYKRSTAVKVKAQAQNVDLAVVRRLTKEKAIAQVEMVTAYIAPVYLRRASQILVYVLCLAMIIGAYMLCVPYFYSVYLAVAAPTIVDYAWLHSSIASLVLMHGLYSYYKENKGVFALPERLANVKDSELSSASHNLSQIVWGFGFSAAVPRLIFMSAAYWFLSFFSFLPYGILWRTSYFLVYGITGIVVVPMKVVVLLVLTIAALAKVMQGLARLRKSKSKVRDIMRIFRDILSLFVDRIKAIMTIAQIAFVVWVGAFILSFAFPPLVILGVNFVPLLNAGILSAYAICCIKQLEYLVAEAFYLSPAYIKTAMFNDGYESDSKIGLSDSDYECDRTNPAVWKEKHAEVMYKRNIRLMIKPIKALLAGAASFAVYHFLMLGATSSALGAVLIAAACAVYAGIFIESFVEDMLLNLVFGRPSDFSYILLPEVARSYKKDPVTNEEHVKHGLSTWCKAKLVIQKTLNTFLMLGLLPISFAVSTIKLPMKFISNFFAKRNGLITKIQLANLLSFVIATLFLVMVTNIMPALAICMSLYINSIVSYGLMNLFGVFATNDVVNKSYPKPSKGFITELLFGFDIDQHYTSDDVEVTITRRDFNKWVNANISSAYIGEDPERLKSCSDHPLGRIMNFKAGRS